MSPLAFVQHPLRWLFAISRYRATTTGVPNFALDLCVNKFSPGEAVGLDLSSLRFLLTGAEPIRSDTLDRFMETFCSLWLALRRLAALLRHGRGDPGRHGNPPWLGI